MPGAILAEDVQAALERLVAAIQAEQQLPGPEKSGDEEDGESVVSLSYRALPLIELLKAAAKAKCNVMWKKLNSLGLMWVEFACYLTDKIRPKPACQNNLNLNQNACYTG